MAAKRSIASWPADRSSGDSGFRRIHLRPLLQLPTRRTWDVL